MLSTTLKAQQRAKRMERERAEAEAAAAKKDGVDAMETDVTTAPAAETEKMDVDEEKKETSSDEKKEGDGDKKEGDGDKKKRAEKEKVGYELGNLSRVLPEQLKYISFLEDGRYEPVKKVCFSTLVGSVKTHANHHSSLEELCCCLIAGPMRMSS